MSEFKEQDDTVYKREQTPRRKSPKKSYWEEDFGDEWVNFTEGVSIDIVIENAEPEEVETTWGLATVIKVREYREGELKSGILKQLRINSKRLRRGLVNASPGGIPTKGNGYTIRRSGEGWSTIYNVTWLGKYKIEEHGSRRLMTGK